MRSGDGQRLRVLLLSPCFGAYGGIEAFVFAVADTILRDPRFDLRICFKRVANFSLQAELDRASRSYPVVFCDRASAALLAQIAWADLVHTQNASPDAAAIAALLRRPRVISVHSVLPRTPRLRRWSWQIAAKTATACWYNSAFVWQSWEGDRRRPTSLRIPPVSQLKSAFVAPAERKGFVFLGRLISGKGADVLIDAYREADLAPAEWPLTIIGEGPMRASLEQRCVREDVRGVHFTGFLEGDNKARALAGAKWLVVPSHWDEPFGLVAVEARNAGVPCIIARDGGLPEAAGAEALVCSPRDVSGLAALLRTASVMPEPEYVVRATRTHDALAEELAPASFYTDAYVQMDKGRVSR